MSGRFSRSLALARASWSVVRADKELLWLPVMSVVATLLVAGTFVVPAVGLGLLELGPAAAPRAPGLWLGVLAFYVVCYFVAIFFNAALVGAAMTRLDGGDPTLRSSLAMAWSRVGRIFGYACIAATVGLVLRMLEDRAGWLGRIAVKLLGVAWSLATFLVVPVLVTRDLGPVEAVNESARLLRETWGENLIGAAGLSLAFAAAYVGLLVLAGVTVALAAQAELPLLIAATLLVAVVAFLVLAALHATLQGVYAAALYRYATGGGAPATGFAPDLMRAAFNPKT